MTTITATVALDAVTLEVDHPGGTAAFLEALGVSDHIGIRASDAPSTGFRGFSLSLVVPQPSSVDALVAAALDAGATALKPVKKSFWGYGGVVQAPDGTVWKVATSSKKETGAPARQIDDIVLLLGVSDVKASKRFYEGRGLSVDKSFGSKYVQFNAAGSKLGLALYGRAALAKDVGVPDEGAGSHRIAVSSGAGAFTDPDGFVWERAV